MAFKAMKIWVVVILMIMLIGSEVECISNSQEFKSMKLPGPLCEAKCDFVCARVGKVEERFKCVEDCKKNKC